jgi:hypothetical protein
VLVLGEQFIYALEEPIQLLRVALSERFLL